jgi:hypothetical protein
MKAKIGKYPYQFQWDDVLKYVPVSDALKERIEDWLLDSRFNNWRLAFNTKRERKVEVRVDYYDSWSAHTTISIIAEPVLRQLYNYNHGFGAIDKEDVPEKLHDTYNDGFSQEAWMWVLEEILFALREDIDGFEKETSYFDFNHDAEPFTDESCKLSDEEGLKAYRDRIQNGFRLFGKYYQSFWD